MYQLNAVPGRTFAALRLDREIDDLEDAESDAYSMSSASKDGLSSAGGNPLAVLMTDMFAPLPLQQRWKMLHALAERWRVSLPSKHAGDKKDACREVIGRLAVKMGRVISRKAEVQQGGQDVGLGTLVGSIGTRRSSRQSKPSVTIDANADLAGRDSLWSQHASERSSVSFVTIESHPPLFFTS
ncbi:putative receptor-type adenylate cyclase GRESAG 4 [Trypanosoma grayi]|uniref:putative receptor-type adenylate cyclase GRESAG 4 n=1 Tax=Trypanosoma grayi TaxID=71804 RepID=UPI0004F4A0C6|nr:putative receptor-type adenylate cyclase GRESAG 4 [Trypanosoma grayi]KEG05393.1 putative receptor-type adenylate cyclase GRESAG 4 [Trypanosoma grayi]